MTKQVRGISGASFSFDVDDDRILVGIEKTGPRLKAKVDDLGTVVVKRTPEGNPQWFNPADIDLRPYQYGVHFIWWHEAGTVGMAWLETEEETRLAKSSMSINVCDSVEFLCAIIEAFGSWVEELKDNAQSKENIESFLDDIDLELTEITDLTEQMGVSETSIKDALKDAIDTLDLDDILPEADHDDVERVVKSLRRRIQDYRD